MSVEDMPKLMSWADVAVSAGGSTVWELAFMGVPSLLCIVAENQKYCVNALAEDGIFLTAGWLKNISPDDIANILLKLIISKELRRGISNKERMLVDGKGVFRIAEEIQKTRGLYAHKRL